MLNALMQRAGMRKSSKPVEGDEIHKSVDDAHKDVERTDAEGGDEEEQVVLVQAVEDAGEAGNVEDTPDDRPNPIAQIRPVAKEGTQDIDDPDEDQADAGIPDSFSHFPAAKLLKAGNFVSEGSERSHNRDHH